MPQLVPVTAAHAPANPVGAGLVFGIRTRLTLLVLVACVPLLLVATYAGWSLKIARDAEVASELGHLLRGISDRLRAEAGAADLLLQTLARHPAIARAPSAGCGQLLAEAVTKTDWFTTFLRTDAGGRVVCASSEVPQPLDLSDRTYFVHARDTRRPVSGQVVLGRASGKPLMVLVHPMLDAAGSFSGIIATGLDLHKFGERLELARPDLKLVFTIWSGDGEILYRYPDHERWARQHAPESGIAQAVAATGAESRTVEAVGLTGATMLYAIRGEEGWSGSRLSLSLGVAKQDLHPRTDAAMYYGALAIGLVFLIALAGAYVLADVSIRRRLVVLEEASARLAAGQYDVRSGLPRGGDEIGRLASTFDAMAGALQSEHDRERASKAALARANRALRVLSECNSVVIHARDEGALLQDMCRILVASGGYRAAWVGFADEARSGRVVPQAQSGFDAGFLEGLQLSWTRGGAGPVEAAMRSGLAQVVRFETGALAECAHGCAVLIGLPLKCDERVFGAIGIHAVDPEAFDSQEIALLGELAADLSHGIQVLRDRKELDRHRGEVEDILRERNEGYGLVLRTAMDGFWIADASGRLQEVNDAYCALIGYSRGELLGMSISDLDAIESPGETGARVRKIIRTGSDRFQTRHRRKDGAVLDVEVSANYHPMQGGRFFVFVRDITERVRLLKALEDAKRVVEAELIKRSTELDESDRRLRLVAAAVEHAPVSVMIVDQAGEIGYVNPAFTRISGYAADEVLGRTPRLLAAGEQDSTVERELLAAGRGGKQWHGEWIGRRKDGTAIVVDLTVAPVRGANRAVTHLVGIAQDVTQRKMAEERLRESESKFRGLIEQSLVGIYMVEDRRVLYMNPRCAEIFGYRPDEVAGMETGTFIAEADRALVAENVRRRLTGEVPSLQYEFRGLRKDGAEILVGVHGSVARMDGRRVILGVLQDITEKRRTEETIRDYVRRLESAVLGTASAVSQMVELRDPYTAGHERRVGELAATIAAEMGMDEYVQRGLRVAGAVHDVGKIMVPAEILSKPGRLSSVEFELVKQHAQQGYEVLKNVAFPWPVAEVARQHHERLDGSGYPRGLKGDEILAEARILAVADVVESMSSHRPYRAGLGIDKALAEIEANSGRLYDVAVVAACLRLFREKGYAIPA